MKNSKKIQKKVILGLLLIILFAIVIVVFFRPQSRLVSIKPDEESFKAPGKNWQSEKKVEDYFVSNLHMTPDEASKVRLTPGSDGKINLRLTQNTTLEALLSNLEYYGFVRDKEVLRYALEKTVDTVPGHANPLKVGNNTIDLWASYRISEDMTAWEIADQLLNHPSYFGFDAYGYMFMP